MIALHFFSIGHKSFEDLISRFNTYEHMLLLIFIFFVIKKKTKGLIDIAGYDLLDVLYHAFIQNKF